MRGIRLRSKRIEYLGQDAAHAIDRDERATRKDVAVGREKRRGWPPAQTVALTNVGPLVGVNANRHESIVDERDDLRIGVSRAIHLVAPVAPRSRNREEHGLALVARSGEGGVAPRLPNNTA